jgi:hypothetical protein
METLKVRIREFHDKLASYLLENRRAGGDYTPRGYGWLLHPRTAKTHGGGSSRAHEVLENFVLGDSLSSRIACRREAASF